MAAVDDEQIESLASNWGRVHNVRIIDSSLFKNYVFTPLGYGSFGLLGTVGRSVFIERYQRRWCKRGTSVSHIL